MTKDSISETFLDRFFPRELREVKKDQEFMNLIQSNIRFQEFGLNFTYISRYAPYVFSNSRAQMTKFPYGVSDLEKIECGNVMLNKRTALL